MYNCLKSLLVKYKIKFKTKVGVKAKMKAQKGIWEFLKVEVLLQLIKTLKIRKILIKTIISTKAYYLANWIDCKDQ